MHALSIRRRTITSFSHLISTLHPTHHPAHDSVVILALPLVTLTPRALARETISIRFLDETACAILLARVSLYTPTFCQISQKGVVLLGGVGLVVHEQELQVTSVVDEEDLVAGGGHVAGLLVVAETDLQLLRGQHHAM